MTLGSASYLAPEQARGSAVGPPADVYALGLTLLESLTGRRAFDGPAVEAVVARLSNDPEIPAGLPQPWPGLLRAMTARDAAQRPTASRVAAVLRGAESVTAPITSVPAGTYDTAVLPAAAPVLPTGRTASRPAPPVPQPPPPRRTVSASLIIAGILVLALVIAGVALLLVNSGGSGGGSPSSAVQTSTDDTAPSVSSSSPKPTTSRTRSTSQSTSTSPTDSAPPTTSESTPSSTPPTTSSSTTSTNTSTTSTSTTRTTTRSRTPAG